MQSGAKTVKEYCASLPDERREVIEKLRKVILTSLPKGFSEEISYGMIGYVIPHSIYPNGYHCDPTLPLPFMSIASQKNFVAVYHMGVYADAKLLKWFTAAYTKQVKGKLDMGKSCIRFKKMDQIPFDLVGELASKMSPKDWITLYEKVVRSRK